MKNTTRAAVLVALAFYGFACFAGGVFWGVERWKQANPVPECDAILTDMSNYYGEWSEFKKLENGKWCVLR